jgi:hypothetical protein
LPTTGAPTAMAVTGGVTCTLSLVFFLRSARSPLWLLEEQKFNRKREDKTRQGKARYDKTRQDKTRTGQDKIRQG